MKLVELNKNEFKTFVDKQEQVTVYQTRNFGIFKKANGWHPYYVGLDDKGKIRAAALILSREIPVMKKRILYSPRGFVINYKDLELLKIFTKEIKKFAENKNAISVRIDPFVIYKQRDINGEVVEDGIDNSVVVDNLKNLGYTHFGFNLMYETLKPRWMHVINTYDKTIDEVLNEMNSSTSDIIKANERHGIHVREITEEELPLFKEILQKSNTKSKFKDYPLSYFQEMWNDMHKDGILKIMIAYVDFDEYLENVLLEKEKFESDISLEEEEIDTKEFDEEIEKIKQYQYDYGHKLNLGVNLLLVYGNEVLSLVDGSLEQFMNFNSTYSLHFEAIKYAVEHEYKRYNLYQIMGDFSNNLLNEDYLFKKQFGGEVVELVGEFDLIINNFWYNAYKKFYPMYEKFKKRK